MKINVVHKRFYMKLHKAIPLTNMKLNLIQSQESDDFDMHTLKYRYYFVHTKERGIKKTVLFAPGMSVVIKIV